MKTPSISAQAKQALLLKQDVISNNLANVTTAGFKKDFVAFHRILDNEVEGALRRIMKTDTQTGDIKQTGNVLDFAIAGPGYFRVETPQGERYTRNGSFQLNATGALVDSNGFSVLTDNGPVFFSPNDAGQVAVSQEGLITVGDRNLGRLSLVALGDGIEFRKTGQNLFEVTRGEPQEVQSEIFQGYLENSTVNPVLEMVEMMDTLRHFELITRAGSLQDGALGTAIEQLSS